MTTETNKKPEATAGKRPSRKPRYFALHEAGLRNGSFFRVWERVRSNDVAQFVNGDYCGVLTVDKKVPGAKVDLDSIPHEMFGIGAPDIVDGIPLTYSGQPLVEYSKAEAEWFIPECCGGKGRSFAYTGQFTKVEGGVR